MAVRQRTGDLVKAALANTDEPEEIRTSSPEVSLGDERRLTPTTDGDGRMDSLLEEGKKLFDKAKQSGFREVTKLAEGLKCFVEAAGSGSQEASERLKSFIVSSNQKRLSFVLEDLPSDLLTMAKIFVEGSETEKEVYKVAKEMFKTMAKGKKEINKSEIDEAALRLMSAEVIVVGVEEVKSVNNLKRSVKRLLAFAVKPNQQGEEVITEEAFCLVACQYARGEMVLPLDNDSNIQLSPENLKKFKESNFIKKVTEFPRQTATQLGHHGLRVIEKYGIRWIWSFFSVKQLYILALVYILPLINIAFVLATLATVVFFAAFLTMFIATFQIIANSTKILWFMEYSTVFRSFSKHGQTINTTDPESRLFKTNAIPYVSYSIATVLTIFTISLAHWQLVIFELLFIISSIVTIAVFVNFECWKSPYILVTISARLLSWLPVLLYLLTDWLPIPEFLFLYGNQLFSIPLLPGVYLDFNLTTLVQVPAQLFIISYFALQHSWENFFFSFGPYILFVSWWVFSRYLFTHCSLLYLGLIIPFLVSMMFLMPFLPLLILLAPVVALMYFGLTFQFLIAIFIIVIMGMVSLFAILNYRRLKEARWLNIPLQYVFLTQIILSIPLLFIGASYYADIYSPANLPVVSINEFNQYCGPTKWNDTQNMIQTQIDCLHLKGRVLNGHATVKSVKIGDVLNDQIVMLNNFPISVRIALTCLMGETKPMCGNAINSSTCKFKGCHFDSSNRYIIKISVVLTHDLINELIDAQLYTTVPHSVIDNCSLLNLRNGDFIDYNATITAGIGSSELILHLQSLRSLSNNSCSYEEIQEENLEEAKQEFISKTIQSFKRVVKFMLETIFGYSVSGYYKP